MIYKFLLAIFVTSLSSIGALIPEVAAQERPKCYLIDNSGQLTDLTDICNVSEKQLPETDSNNSEAQNSNNQSNNNNNNIIIDSGLLDTGLSLDHSTYILGENSIASKQGSFESAYYVDNGTGTDYTAYIRRYKTTPTSMTRQTIREQAFQFDAPNSLTAVLRQGRKVPFIIYRY